MKTILRCIVLSLLVIFGVQGAEIGPAKPTAKDKCPVCGMFVSKYPDWVAQIVFQDGSVAFFDGIKDLLKYQFNLQKYNRTQTRTNIASIFVTDYYSLEAIDGRQAWYVAGSDVYGPMGRELIPFKQETEARVFLKDHKGKRLLRYPEITDALVKE